jgi:thiol-disulfide isomerase/thioredoxin
MGRASLAAAAVGVVAAALYVTAGGGGNGAEAAACAATAADAKALAPLVHGEVAAFQVARQPQSLSGLAFTGVNGEARTLGDLGGKVALVNLWATWCAPCRKEMPALDRLQGALGGPEFEVVPISIDTTGPERAAEFLKGIGVERLPLYTDRTTEIFHEVKKRSLALGLPVSILVGRNGCHLGHMNAPAEWDSPEGQALIRAALGKAGVQS